MRNRINFESKLIIWIAFLACSLISNNMHSQNKIDSLLKERIVELESYISIPNISKFRLEFNSKCKCTPSGMPYPYDYVILNKLDTIGAVSFDSQNKFVSKLKIKNFEIVYRKGKLQEIVNAGDNIICCPDQTNITEYIYSQQLSKLFKIDQLSFKENIYFIDFLSDSNQFVVTLIGNDFENKRVRFGGCVEDSGVKIDYLVLPTESGSIEIALSKSRIRTITHSTFTKCGFTVSERWEMKNEKKMIYTTINEEFCIETKTHLKNRVKRKFFQEYSLYELNNLLLLILEKQYIPSEFEELISLIENFESSVLK